MSAYRKDVDEAKYISFYEKHKMKKNFLIVN